MPVHQNLPPCPKKWVNLEELEATVELSIDRGRSIDRDELYKILMRNGVGRDEFLGSYQLERFDVWYCIFESSMVAEEWVKKNPFIYVEERDDDMGVDQTRKMHAVLYNCVDVEVRYMWVPSVIRIEYVKFVMGQWGTLKNIHLQHNQRNQTTYVATLSMSLKQRDELPHTTDIPGYPRKQLVTMRGRQQLCLYCNKLGHMRYSCPKKTEDIARKYDRPQRQWAAPERQDVADITVPDRLPVDEDTQSTTSDATNATNELNGERDDDTDIVDISAPVSAQTFTKTPVVEEPNVAMAAKPHPQSQSLFSGTPVKQVDKSQQAMPPPANKLINKPVAWDVPGADLTRTRGGGRPATKLDPAPGTKRSRSKSVTKGEGKGKKKSEGDQASRARYMQESGPMTSGSLMDHLPHASRMVMTMQTDKDDSVDIDDESLDLRLSDDKILPDLQRQ
jgi:hypothetical protein